VAVLPVKDVVRTPERLVGVALAGAVALNFPLLYLFGGPGTVFGVPRLYVYIFVVWAVVIALLALVIRAPRRDRESRGEIDRGPPRA